MGFNCHNYSLYEKKRLFDAKILRHEWRFNRQKNILLTAIFTQQI